MANAIDLANINYCSVTFVDISQDRQRYSLLVAENKLNFVLYKMEQHSLDVVGVDCDSNGCIEFDRPKSPPQARCFERLF